MILAMAAFVPGCGRARDRQWQADRYVRYALPGERGKMLRRIIGQSLVKNRPLLRLGP